jgi:hypothetical protein
MGLLGYSFAYKQIRREEIKKELLVGKWNYSNGVVGNVIMVFDKDGTGHRFTDSSKIVQKFKYQITRESFLEFYIGSHKPEIYHIDSLTTQTLNIREYPFKKIKESISVYESNFKRGNPAHGQPTHIFVSH